MSLSVKLTSAIWLLSGGNLFLSHECDLTPNPQLGFEPLEMLTTHQLSYSTITYISIWIPFNSMNQFDSEQLNIKWLKGSWSAFI